LKTTITWNPLPVMEVLACDGKPGREEEGFQNPMR
jgi:hypothetical protein